MRVLPVLLFLLVGPSDAPGQTPTPVLPDLDRLARSLVQQAPPLALSIAVVQGDSIVHLAGYGRRHPDSAAPVTPRTAFYIASSTKSFTALTAAVLAARGVVDLDAPIRRYVPEFALPAPLDAASVTLRRLLSHRGGFESGPLSFRTAYVGDLSADSLFTVLVRSAVPVDTGFTYTNTAFIIAARVLERVTGTPWQQLIARELLVPLSLSRTTAYPSQARDWELVTGYGPGRDGLGPVAPKTDATMHAAGGMLMSAADAAVWLKAQLNGGIVDGRRILPAATVEATHLQLASQRANFLEIRSFGYALGWQIGELDGDTIYHHFGNYPGAFAHVSFVPARRVGVVVFSNTELPAFGPVTSTIARRAYDLLAGRPDRDLMYESYADSVAARVNRMKDFLRADFQRRTTRPTVPPRGWRAYAGTYDGGDMGSITIVVHGDSAAELRYGTARSALEVFSGDTLRVEMPPGRSGSPVPAEFGEDGRAQTIRVAGFPFTRRSAR